MMRTKILAIATTVALCTGVAACGGGDGTDAATGPVGTTGEARDGDTAGESAAGADEESSPAEGDITMSDNEFSPTTVQAKPGESLRVVNTGSAVHNLVEKKTDIESGDVEPDATAQVKAPAKAGTYQFVCTYHAGMEGTLKVA